MEKGIEEKYGATLCALRSYKSIGFFSREYAIMRSREILAETIKEYESKSERDKEILLPKLKSAKLLTYRELFEKLILSIEDLAAIFTALTHPLNEFAEYVTKEPNIKKAFSNITDEKIMCALKYGNIDYYEKDEYQIVKKYRDIIFESHKKIFDTILKFYKINEKAYIRMKHGNSLFYTIDTIMIDGLESFVIPVQYNTKDIKNVDVLILNDFIYEKMYNLFYYIQQFERILCDLNEDFIASGEKYHPVGLIPKINDENEQKIIEAIIKKYSKKQTFNINTKLSLSTSQEKINNIIEFYKKIPL